MTGTSPGATGATQRGAADASLSSTCDNGLAHAVARKGSLRQTFQAVAWSFMGIRRSRDQAEDMARLNPVHVIIAGIVSAALFVTVLVLAVNWVVGSGVAK